MFDPHNTRRVPLWLHLACVLLTAVLYLAHFLPDTEALVLDHEIFVDQKPAYYAFANATDKKTGAEVFAAFS